MLSITIILGFLGLSILFGYLSHIRYNYDDLYLGLSVFLGVSSFAGIIFILCTLPNINNVFKTKIEVYNNLKVQVEKYNSDTINVTDIALKSELTKQIIEMNNEISEHKIQSQSLWIGPWYSEEIGKLEKLQINY